VYLRIGKGFDADAISVPVFCDGGVGFNLVSIGDLRCCSGSGYDEVRYLYPMRGWGWNLLFSPG